MSIPVERRDISDGWVITCRGKNGGDLTLSEVKVESKNLICRVMGSQNVLVSKEQNKAAIPANAESHITDKADKDVDLTMTEVSILNDIKELIVNAQQYGSWKPGRGGVDQSISLSGTPLDGLPMSEVLRCAVQLWQNLEMDDDELMEIAIRDM